MEKLSLGDRAKKRLDLKWKIVNGSMINWWVWGVWGRATALL
jgi:hypothetical protein